MQKVKCHAAMLILFFFFTSDYLIVCNYSNTSEVEISCRTYNSGAVNYHFLLPLNLSF